RLGPRPAALTRIGFWGRAKFICLTALFGRCYRSRCFRKSIIAKNLPGCIIYPLATTDFLFVIGGDAKMIFVQWQTDITKRGSSWTSWIDSKSPALTLLLIRLK